jgi:hypothetical protein
MTLTTYGEAGKMAKVLNTGTVTVSDVESGVLL